MAIGNVMQLKVTGTVFGKTCQNVYWYVQTGGSAGTAAQHLANAFSSAYESAMLALLSEDAELQRIDVINYQTPSDVGVVAYGLPNPGDVASEAAPSQWTVSVSMNRPQAGWNYPRKDLWGFPLTVFSGNDVAGATKTAVEAIMEDLCSVSSGGNTYVWNVLRPSAGFRLGNPVCAAYPIASVVKIFDGSRRSRRN